MIRKDYLERLIALAAQALAQIAGLLSTGELDPALNLVRRTTEEVLGPLGPVLQRLDAASAVEIAGRFEIERIRLWAALLAEEGAIQEARGRADEADACYRRSLELYAAGAAGGVRLLEADRERVRELRGRVEVQPRYRAEVEAIARS